MKKIVLGVDIGNVIIDYRPVDKNDMSLFEKRYSTIPKAKGAFEVLKELNESKFKGNIFLVSKCVPESQEKIISWLSDNDFYNQTDIKPENVFFCRERSEKDKICREKGITHFVDDRLEVLSHMINSVPNLFLYQPDQAEVDEFKEFLPKVTVVNGWEEVLEKIK